MTDVTRSDVPKMKRPESAAERRSWVSWIDVSLSGKTAGQRLIRQQDGRFTAPVHVVRARPYASPLCGLETTDI